VRCRAPEIIDSSALLKHLALGRRLVDVTFRRLRVAVSGGVLALISGSATPARALIGRRLGPVALRRVLVTTRGGVLAIISGCATQPRTLISRRLSPVTLSRSRLTPLSRALPLHRGMTTVPPALIELRRLRIRFDAQLALGANRHSVVALVARGVRSSARVFISLGQIRSGRTGCPGSLLLC